VDLWVFREPDPEFKAPSARHPRQPGVLDRVLRIATPLIFGTLGVLLCERAGVLNLGIEGIMVAGAFTGWLAVYAGLPLWAGVAWPR
jgi:ABC-type uncharacterized transport system permease subunit